MQNLRFVIKCIVNISEEKHHNMVKEIKNIALTVISALLSALTLHVFVADAGFAPSGVDGIATMLQHITGISMGLFTFAINMPLLIIALFVLKKRYVIYTVLFTVFSSGFLVVLEKMNFYQFEHTDEGLLIALISGALLGIRTAIMLKIQASSGGIDIIAGFIQKYSSHINIERIITAICWIISLLSIFVYKNTLSIILSFIQMFVFDRAADYVLKDTRHAVEFKIITKDPDKLIHNIIYELKHGATIVESRGAFSDDSSYMITTIINIRQIPELLNIVKKEDGAFVYYTEAKGITGNFRWNRDDEVK